jgi:hypothetical protein
MKNALLSGLIIGVLSGAWLFVMHAAGYNSVTDNNLSPIEYLSVLIPLFGLYFGVKSYRDHEEGGVIGFLEALIQGFKILVAGGVVAIAFAILYVNYIQMSINNISDFSGRMFGALLVGILFDFVVSLVLMNKSKAI